MENIRQLVAQALSEVNTDYSDITVTHALEDVVEHLVEDFYALDPNFSKEGFWNMCGFEDCGFEDRGFEDHYV